MFSYVRADLQLYLACNTTFWLKKEAPNTFPSVEHLVPSGLDRVCMGSLIKTIHTPSIFLSVASSLFSKHGQGLDSERSSASILILVRLLNQRAFKLLRAKNDFTIWYSRALCAIKLTKARPGQTNRDFKQDGH